MSIIVKPETISDDLVEKVEDMLGMGSNAWDTINPKEIIAAAAQCYINHVDSNKAEHKDDNQGFYPRFSLA